MDRAARTTLLILMTAALLVACDAGGGTGAADPSGAAGSDTAPATAAEPPAAGASAGPTVAAAIPDSPGNGVTAEEIRIGWMGDITGPTASAQQANLLGTQAYLELVNSRGGLLGRDLVLVEEDDQFSAETAAINFRSLVDDDQVLAIVNMGGSHISEALMPQVEAEQIPLVAPPGTFPSQIANPYVFNSNIDTDGTAAIAVARLIERVGDAESLVTLVLHLNIPSGEEWNTVMQDHLAEQGGTYAGAIGMDPAAIDAPGVIAQVQERIRTDQVNAIALQAAPGQVLALATELSAAGLTDLPIVGIQGLAAPSIFLEGPQDMWDAIEGIHSFLPVNVPSAGTEEMAEFVAGNADWEAQAGQPYFTNGWLGGLFLEQAITRAAQDAGSLDRARLYEALQGPFDVKGLTCETDWTGTNYIPCGVPFHWDGEGLQPVEDFAYWDQFLG